MHNARNALLVAIATLSLVSCGAIDGFSIVRANRLYRDGYIHEAAAIYLKAGAGVESVASYDLANAFVALGEAKPARQLYEVSIASGQPAAAARSWYNIGAQAYSEAEYDTAADSFRKAIEAFAGEKDDALRRELARAYELAIMASDDKRQAGAIEHGAYGSGRPGGDQQSFSLSRMNEKTLYIPGGTEAGTEVDQ